MIFNQSVFNQRAGFTCVLMLMLLCFRVLYGRRLRTVVHGYSAPFVFPTHPAQWQHLHTHTQKNAAPAYKIATNLSYVGAWFASHYVVAVSNRRHNDRVNAVQTGDTDMPECRV